MWFVQDFDGDAKVAPILSTYEEYGCNVNAIAVEDLFRRYEQSGFLYPAKKKFVEPHLPLIQDNWRRAMTAGEQLHYVVTYQQNGNHDPEAWATVSTWRSTQTGFQTQHLVAVGGPSASRAVLLAAQGVRVHNYLGESTQNWFRPNNRFANRIFGSCGSGIDRDQWHLVQNSYLAVPPAIGVTNAKIKIERGICDRSASVSQAVLEICGPVYTKAHDLEHDDLELDAVNEMYRRVGLFRYRRIWLAFVGREEKPAAVAIAYRGPLGFNFSLLENRCDMLVRPGTAPEDIAPLLRSLILSVAPTYEDFPLGFVPVTTAEQNAPVLIDQGAVPIRTYLQSIWLRPAFSQWYRHVERFYRRLGRNPDRHGLAHTDQDT
jgi:hypothetical protein